MIIASDDSAQPGTAMGQSTGDASAQRDGAQPSDIDELLRKLGDAQREEQGPSTVPSSTSAETPTGATLNERHLAYLAARAVDITAALAAGMRSVDGEEGGRLVGFGRALTCGAMAIPYPGSEPPYTRLRLDEQLGDARFLAPAGRSVPLYVLPLVIDAMHETPIVVVEGPVKAAALCAHGVLSVALGGTGTTLETKSGHRGLNSSWGPLDVTGRQIVLLFDSNRRTNPSVARDEGRLALALEESGAVVRVGDLPRDERIGEWGPDDFLAARGVDALRAVVNLAAEASPVTRVQTAGQQSDAAQRAEEAARLLEDLPFLLSIIERGSGAEQRVRAALRKMSVSAKAFDAALTQVKKKITEANKAAAVATPQVNGQQRRYDLHEGRLSQVVMTKDGVEFAPLTNFSARIDREIVTDDGAEERLRFEIRGALADGTPLPAIIVEAENFSAMHWVVGRWGARAILQAEPSTPHHLRAAMQELSSPERTRVYAHSGFRLIDGKLVYLHGDGAIGGEGILTHLDGPLARYRLPSAIDDPRGAVKVSLQALEVAPLVVTVPLLAATFRAPACSLLPCDYTLWLLGITGSTKSTIVAQFMRHFGSDFTRLNLPANWSDTTATIEYRAFAAKDALFTIDDFAPKGSESWDDLRKKADQVLRAIGNQSSRGRMRPDVSARPNRPPRCLVIATGEDLPNGQSILARTVPVNVRRECVKLERLSQLEAQGDRLGHAMAAYITWLIPRYEKLGAHLENRLRLRRTEFSAKGGGHLRTPEALANLSLGIELFTDFAQDIGVFGAKEATKFLRTSLDTLRELGTAQGAAVNDADPVDRFLIVLRELHTQGRVRFRSTDTPLHRDTSDPSTCEVIGWSDNDFAYLLPDATLREVMKAMAGARESMPIKPRTLWQRLVEQGKTLKGDDEEHHTLQRTLGGKRPRVIVMHWSALEEREPSPPPRAPPSSPATPAQTTPRGTPPPTPPPPANRSNGTENRCNQAENRVTGDLEPGHSFGEEVEEILEFTNDPSSSCPGFSALGSGFEVAHIAVVPTSFGPEKKEASFVKGEPHSPYRVPGKPGQQPPSTGANTPELLEADLPNEDSVPRFSGGMSLSTGYTLVMDPVDLGSLAGLVDRVGQGFIGVSTQATGTCAIGNPLRLLLLQLPGQPCPTVVDLVATGGLGPLAQALRGARLTGHDLQHDLALLRRAYGVEPAGLWDTLLASKLIDAGPHLHDRAFHDIAAITHRALEIKLEPLPVGAGSSRELFPALLLTVAQRLQHTIALRAALASQITGLKLDEAMQLENDVLPTVVDMMLAGVPFNRAKWFELVVARRARAEALASELRATLGVDNVDSSSQVSKALSKLLGAPIAKTNAEALASFHDVPVVAALHEYRQKITFVRGPGEAILTALDESPDGRVRASFDQLGTPTGRFAVSGPNLLGLPNAEKDPEVRACIEARGRFVDADYAAIELRVLAAVAPSIRLSEVFAEGGDPHRIMAADLLGKPPETVTSSERKRAKPVNFGAAYGVGAESFRQRALKDYGVNFTVDEAREALSKFPKTWRGIGAWQRRTRREMVGEMRSASGRRRVFTDKDGYTERLNTPIQATAADGMKAALVLLRAPLKKYGAKLLLCAHDQVLVETSVDVTELVRSAVVTAMEDGMARYVSGVPIKVESAVQSAWK